MATINGLNGRIATVCLQGHGVTGTEAAEMRLPTSFDARGRKHSATTKMYLSARALGLRRGPGSGRVAHTQDIRARTGSGQIVLGLYRVKF
jgi:hypothetical protein